MSVSSQDPSVIDREQSEAGLTGMSAVQAAAAIQSGERTAEELVQACLDRIAEMEYVVQAWAHLDAEHALAQARKADEARRAGINLGPLHGVPVGVKDIFDTHDMPTEDGTVLHAGRRPQFDATAVALLRQAGAVILGKTVTTELAVYGPGKTTNPHDPTRTPGGSSSGSAAAVAAHMVPLAIGTQTNGSVIRPASYCGVYGFKPSHGLISRHRILQLSRPLDTVGVFARSIEDVALIAEQLMRFDEHDPDTRPQAAPKLIETVAEAPPVTPQFALVKTPVWDQADATTQAAIMELAEFIGDDIEEVVLPDAFEKAIGWLQTIMEADLARSFEREYTSGKERLSSILCEMIARGKIVTAVDYNNAVGQVGLLNAMLNRIFQKYDAIVTPATTGEAPSGLGSTGSPIFCTIWTLCGVPSVTVPLLEGANGMPLGVQLVGAKGDDARLLRTARWLVRTVQDETGETREVIE